MDPIVPPAGDAWPPSSDPGQPGPAVADPVVTDVAAPGPDDPPRRRWRRRSIAAAVVVGLLVATVIAAGTVKVDYYRYAPGNLYPTEALINVDGAPTFHDDGSIDMTTVSSRQASVLDQLLCGGTDEDLGCRFDDAVELVEKEKVDGGRPPEETQRQNQELMDDSKHIAAVVALEKLGYPVQVEGAGALVRSVAEGSPAEAAGLRFDDVILAVDDQRVSLADEAVEIIGSHAPGDTIVLSVERPKEGIMQVPVTLAPRPDEPARGYVGVSLGTRNLHYELPFEVSIDSKKVTGPSGGLAFTLGVMDVLTPGSLTGGRRIAATGTIDAKGVVGPVGGVRQKMAAARRDEVAYFLVPQEEYELAKQHAGGLDLISVHTLDDALAAIAQRGGDTAPVEQAIAAGTTTTVGR